MPLLKKRSQPPTVSIWQYPSEIFYNRSRWAARRVFFVSYEIQPGEVQSLTKRLNAVLIERPEGNGIIEKRNQCMFFRQWIII